MIDAPDSPYRVPFDGGFLAALSPTSPPGGVPHDKAIKKRQADLTERMYKLQDRLFAEGRRSLLVIFQALDAAGKDGTIRAVMTGVNPAGCQVSSFKAPSSEELSHDFLWRTSKQLPPRGYIGIFNRSYYEEVLVVRVHPKLLAGQRVPVPEDPEELWAWRMEAIRAHELYLARQGVTILKLWLHVSPEEQRKRLLQRIDDPDRNWKFNEEDIGERQHWDAYMRAYQAALNETSRPWAPWYAIPADDKDYMRWVAADLIVAALDRMDPHYPAVDEAQRVHLRALRGGLARKDEK